MKIIHETAIIYPNVTIEDDVYIGPYCIIGAPPEWKGKEHESKGVYIAQGTRITGLVTIDSGALGLTYIGRDCYLMKGAHVGHDAILKNGVTLSCGAKIGGHSEIGENTNIGLNATIHQKLKIPEGCMIGMGAVVTKKTELSRNCKYAGVPAKFIGFNDRNHLSQL